MLSEEEIKTFLTSHQEQQIPSPLTMPSWQDMQTESALSVCAIPALYWELTVSRLAPGLEGPLSCSSHYRI